MSTGNCFGHCWGRSSEFCVAVGLLYAILIGSNPRRLFRDGSHALCVNLVVIPILKWHCIMCKWWRQLWSLVEKMQPPAYMPKIRRCHPIIKWLGFFHYNMVYKCGIVKHCHRHYAPSPRRQRCRLFCHQPQPTSDHHRRRQIDYAPPRGRKRRSLTDQRPLATAGKHAVVRDAVRCSWKTRSRPGTERTPPSVRTREAQARRCTASRRNAGPTTTHTQRSTVIIFLLLLGPRASGE